MKPKNVMLLGFVNRAVEYLDSHFDEQPDSRLAELKNIDLASLRDELVDNLDTSLGTMQSTMATLLKAGNEAFDQFVEDSKGQVTAADEFDKLFDVDLDGAKKEKQQQLAKLLSFYNLDDDFDEAETVFAKEPVEEIKDDVVKVDEDDEYIQQIIRNIAGDNYANDYSFINNDLGDTSELDNVFSEIVINEQLADDNIQAQFVKEEQPTVVDPVIEETFDTVNEKQPTDIEEASEVVIDEQPIVEPIEDEQTEVVVEEQPTIIEETVEPIIDEQSSVTTNVEPLAVEEKTVETILEEKLASNGNNTESVKYVNSLISDLKEQLKKEDAAKQEAINDNREVYERISKLYPYLSNSFIKVVYDLKTSLSNDYPLGKRIIVLHRVLFKEVDNLRKFVEICLNHDYQINADEEKMIVDVFKEFVNADGKILANIYEISNQGSLLGGNYEGYNVIINEEE